MSQNKELVMSFEPQTIEHLGVKMYSTLPPALAEMIANSYDACSKNVSINLFDSDPENKMIVIKDDGVGMSFDEINDFFLRIGRNRRKEGHKHTNCERLATGKKGLGKLALFGIGEKITIVTIQSSTAVQFVLDWGKILESKNRYTPEFQISDTSEPNGTTITLENLKRKSLYSIDALASSLAMMFNFKGSDFQVQISLNNGEPLKIDHKLKYQKIVPEFSWDIRKLIEGAKSSYEYSDDITGEIITTEKPLQPNLRGITLFANGRLVNAPEFFSQSESSHFYSYTTGWLNVDFVDEWEEDVISTNRQSIDWDYDRSQELKNYLKDIIYQLERTWREMRKSKRQDQIEVKTQINIKQWYATLPSEIQAKIEHIVTSVDNSELSEQNQVEVVRAIHELVPEYPNLHWRHLHSTIQEASRIDYQNRDYYRAFEEAVKRYILATRQKSNSISGTDGGMMGEVYGKNKVLGTTKKYKRPNGSEFTASTLESIEEGQKFMSMGILSGARNPVAHEEIVDLRESGLFSEKDCLDALSLLSHLMRRLEDAEVSGV